MERRRFMREFKLRAVRLIRDRGVSYAQASQDLTVHPTQLRQESTRSRCNTAMDVATACACPFGGKLRIK